MDYTEICNECKREIPIGYMYQDFGLCWDCGFSVKREYEKAQSKASLMVRNAIAIGELTRPDTCQLCGKAPVIKSNRQIMAHHWRGYEGDAALDVWFICASCNGRLQGRKYHDGSLTQEQARAFIQS